MLKIKKEVLNRDFLKDCNCMLGIETYTGRVVYVNTLHEGSNQWQLVPFTFCPRCGEKIESILDK